MNERCDDRHSRRNGRPARTRYIEPEPVTLSRKAGQAFAAGLAERERDPERMNAYVERRTRRFREIVPPGPRMEAFSLSVRGTF